MIKKTSSALLLTLLGATVSNAQWTQVGSDDFESYSFGAPLSGTDWHEVNSDTSTTVNQFVTNATGGTNSAGKLLPTNTAGTGNALYYFDDSTSGTARAALNLNTSTNENYEIAYVSVDFSFVTVDSNSTAFGVIGLTAADNTTYGNPASRAVSINALTNGSLSWSGGSTTVANPTASHNLSIVANGSDSSYSYSALDSSGTISLSSKSFDLYVDNTLVGSSIGFTTAGVELGRFGITTFSTSTGVDFMIDNLESYAIPESSSTAMLLGLFTFMLLIPTRRFIKKREQAPSA